MTTAYFIRANTGEISRELKEGKYVDACCFLSDFDFLGYSTCSEYNFHRAFSRSIVSLSCDGEAILRHLIQREPVYGGGKLHLHLLRIAIEAYFLGSACDR